MAEQPILDLCERYRVSVSMPRDPYDKGDIGGHPDGRHFKRRYRRFAVELLDAMEQAGIAPEPYSGALRVACACGACDPRTYWHVFDLEAVGVFRGNAWGDA